MILLMKTKQNYVEIYGGKSVKKVNKFAYDFQDHKIFSRAMSERRLSSSK